MHDGLEDGGLEAGAAFLGLDFEDLPEFAVLEASFDEIADFFEPKIAVGFGRFLLQMAFGHFLDGTLTLSRLDQRVATTTTPLHDHARNTTLQALRHLKWGWW